MSKTVSGKANPAAFALEFIGSLIYLIMVYITSAGNTAAGAFAPALSTVWLPLLYSAGVLSAVVLFIVSFFNLLRHNPFANSGMLPAVIGGFAFIALGAGSTYVGLALVGFIFAVFGAMYTKLGYE